MALVAPTLDDLLAFVGSTVATEFDSDSDYATSLLQQVTDLLEITTGVSTLPTDALELRIFKYGLCELTMFLFLAQNHRAAQMSPFSSETIGSYSYAKAQGRASGGMPIGLLWFDLLVALFLGDTDAPLSTSTSVFEDEGVYVNYYTGRGRRVLGPQDSSLVRSHWADGNP